MRSESSNAWLRVRVCPDNVKGNDDLQKRVTGAVCYWEEKYRDCLKNDGYLLLQSGFLVDTWRYEDYFPYVKQAHSRKNSFNKLVQHFMDQRYMHGNKWTN